ncbi:MAG TPA: DUF2993 domain-containing protein [Jatrophihabitantaceae bacterium]|nr:DUF2993 domain-containing protein [Jatrophihabitantaceae bacterium]
MTIVVVVVLVLVALALAAALADRVGAGLAERKASEFVSEPFGHPASVRVHGTPFLTQALRGRYSDVEVSGGGLQVGEMSGATLDAHLHNVLLPLGELLGGRTSQLACQRITGRIVLPYGELARVSRIPGLTLTFENGRLMASAAVPVPGISQLARVSGEAVLRVMDGDTVWLRIRRVAVAGISVPSLIMRQLLPTLSVPIPIPSLPYGLHLDDLTPSLAGLVVTASADSVVFSAS